jgi:hypothetical protein
MSDKDPSDADPFGEIADEFVEAFRQGQRPSVEEFAHRYSAHDDDIRDILPALVCMEEAKSGDDTSGQRRRARTWAAVAPQACLREKNAPAALFHLLQGRWDWSLFRGGRPP